MQQHFFPEVSSIWELKTSLRQKLIWRKNDTATGHENPMALVHNGHQEKKCRIYFSDDCGLRHPVIPKKIAKKKVYLSRSTGLILHKVLPQKTWTIYIIKFLNTLQL